MPLTFLFLCILFSGVEKKNDDFRRFFHRKINRWDACTSLLLVEKRQEALRCCVRRRTYTKRDTGFWYEGGKQDSARKVPRISAVEQVEVEIQQVSSSAIELPAQQMTITQSARELKKMKIPELLQLLANLTGQQPSLPRKPRKPDIISKISEIAIFRSE